MDRRLLSVVFTLELLNGLVLGQTSLNVKICSSPKRDRDRNENLFKLKAAKKCNPSQELNETVDSDSDKSSAATFTSANVKKMKSDLNAISYHLQRADQLFTGIAQAVKTLESNFQPQ